MTYVATLGTREPDGKTCDWPDDATAVPRRFPHLLDDGRLTWRDFFNYSRLPNGDFMLNWPIGGNDVFGDYLASLEERRRVIAAAKTKTLSLIDELKERFPACRFNLSPEYGTDRFPTSARRAESTAIGI
jgi:hypothetical protein